MLENLRLFYLNIVEHHELFVILSFLTIILIVLLISWIVNLILNKYIVKSVKHYLEESNSDLGQILVKHNVFKRLSHIGPGIFIYLAISLAVYPDHSWTISIPNAIEPDCSTIYYFSFYMVLHCFR